MGGVRQVPGIGSSLLVLVLAGCLNGPGQESDGATRATASSERPATSRMTANDVEAPDVFGIADQGLWDGRPSLGGIWVAYPDVADPERVIIRNQGNGKFVIGALFKRERENPGPRFQVSADAAAALGMLAGAPTRLDVTALRRPEPVAPAPAALPVPDGEPAQAATASAAQVAQSGTGVAREGRSWNPFKRRNAATAATAASGLDAGEVSVAPLEASGQPAQAPAPRPEARAAAPALAKPYVAVGNFEQEADASAAVARLRENGLAAEVSRQDNKGKTVWRVLSGPVASKADRTALIKKAKAMGFSGAYPVRG